MLNNNIGNLQPEVEESIFIKSTVEEFNEGTFQNCITNSEIGDGAIFLDKNEHGYISSGEYISKEIATVPFQNLVISWNSDTPEETYIAIEARVFIKYFNLIGQEVEEWTDWLSWGTWGSYIERASSQNNVDSPLAFVDVDTLVVKGDNGETASRLQFKISLYSQNPLVTPSVRLISGTIRNNLSGQEIVKTCSYPNISNLTNIELDVPKFSQTIRDPQIAGSICSPTSVTMILNYWGINILPEESAWGIYDKVYDGFGNWPFNTGFISSFGYRSYVEYSTIECLKTELCNGYPVVVSVCYKNRSDVSGNVPVVEGAPIPITYGHLIVVRGYKKDELGNEYIIVNDPAAASNDKVRLEYKLNQFEEAWNKSGKIAYIMHDKEIGAGYAKPQRLQAKLLSIGKNRIEYKLVYNNKDIDISENYIKTIMFTKDQIKYQYKTPTQSKTLTNFSKKQRGTFHYLFISKDGKTYAADLNL